MRLPRASQTDLTKGAVVRLLAGQFLPLLSGSLIFASVSVAEGYFVSGLGTDALAVFGQLSPFILLASGMFFGFANGITSTISRALGAGRQTEASTAAAISYALVLPFVVIYLASCYFAAPTIFQVMGGQRQLLESFLSFLKVWAWAVPAGALLYVSTAVLRARGGAIMASVMLSTSALINLVLGPTLIFGLLGLPKLGIVGVAWANGLGMLLAGTASLLYLKHKGFLALAPGSIGVLAKDIFVGSAFAIGTYCVQPTGRFLLLSIMGGFGKETVAALAVLFLIDRFMLNVFVALSSALAPLVGQNWGKQRFDRVRHGISAALCAATIVGIVAWLAVWAFAGSVAAVFASDSTVFELVRVGLTIYPVYIVISALVLICCAAFNATANAAFATGFVTFGQLLMIPACVYLGETSYGFAGALLGMVIGQAGVATLCLVSIYKITRSTAVVVRSANGVSRDVQLIEGTVGPTR